MFLTLPDIIIILVIFGFAMYGFIMGLIQAIGSLAGFFLGAWVGSLYFQPFGNWLTPYILNNQRIAYLVAFILIFIIVSKLIGLAFLIIEKFFHLISIIPFLKTINRIAGAILGLLEGLLFTSLVVYIINQLFSQGPIHELIATSKVAAVLLVIAQIIIPLLPELLKTFKTEMPVINTIIK